MSRGGDGAKTNPGIGYQFKVRVPEEQRISGRLYDYFSGVCMGLASDEDKQKYPVNQPFHRNISGCPHKLVIHP